MGGKSSPQPEEASKSKRTRVAAFFKESLDVGLVKGKDKYLEAKLQLQQSLGLGHKPNVIPPMKPDIRGPYRKVELGWHPVAGFAGKWFAEQTGLGKKITESINRYPDPTQHWAILVDQYSHELWMDEHLHVIYINGVVKREEWHTFEVGKTRFNDEALRQAGEMVIYNMRQKKPGYNLINNNCQTFAMAMLDAIQVGAHIRFATTMEIYQRATGKGSIKDLFLENPPEEETEDEAVVAEHDSALSHAQQVMDENTTKLDTHHSLH